MPFAPLAINSDVLEHLAIRASAGSGKTHQLVSRYLQLVASGAPPSSILASTFTRLAAGQIRDRILTALAKAAEDDVERSKLAGRIGVKALSRQDVADMLAHLAGQLHRMQVRTLDSFFAAIVSGFAVELELPLGASVIDDVQDAQLRGEAIRLMLDERRPQDLVDLLRKLIQDRSDRGVCESVDSTISTLHSLFLESHPGAWECVPVASGERSRAEVSSMIIAMERYTPPSDKRVAPAYGKALAAVRSRRWDEVLGNGLASAILSGECTYYKKPLPEDLIDVFEPLVIHARAVIIGRWRDQTLATRDLLALFDHHYRAVKASQRAITFADLTSGMADALRLGKMDDICFRIDATMRHMLLDEFQDTSIPQWRALEGMVREIISVAPPERTLFCVGDVKQSIYGWRSAAPEVLDELPQLLVGGDGRSAIHVSSLSKSYRSSPVIIDAVNQVFESLGSNVALDGCRAAERAWSAGFEHHTTEKKDFVGRAELRLMPRIEGDAEDRFLARCKSAAALVADLHRANPRMSVAVLMRRNKGVARMLFELGPGRLDIPVTGRGGGPLTDAPAVNAVLDLLRLADHPDDTIAAFNVARSPLGAMIGLVNHADEPARWKIARDVRLDLLHKGYADTISQLVAGLAPTCNERELGRLVQLVDLAGEHDQQWSLRTVDFIERVENSAVPRSRPAPVQVMTIHQAKGLEFDAVVLPELEWKLIGAAPTVVCERDGETGPMTRICCYRSDAVRALLPELQPLFDRHEHRAARESLSLLYVAMTRAIHGLYMLIDPPKENADGSPSAATLRTAAGVLRTAMTSGSLKPGETVYFKGDPKWMHTLEEKDAEAVPAPEQKIASIRLAPSVKSAARGGKTSSASTLAAALDSATSVGFGSIEPRERGTVLHAMFEQIEWLEDFKPNIEPLMLIARRKAARRDGAWHRQRVEEFLAALRHSAVAETLSCNGRDRRRFQVYRELPFARLVDGAVQQGFIDRVLLERDSSGRVSSATIIDFKTDSLAMADCQACAEKYAGQMNTYREAIAAWLGLPSEGISRSLLFVAPGVRVDL